MRLIEASRLVQGHTTTTTAEAGLEPRHSGPRVLTYNHLPHTASFRPFPGPVATCNDLVFPASTWHSEKYLWHEFLDQVAMSTRRLAGSSSETQRQGLRVEDFLESSRGGGQSRSGEMRAEDPRVGHDHAYLDWCQCQCMVSSAQCALRHGTCHPSPSLSSVLSPIPYGSNANHPPPASNLPGCLTLLPGLP